MTELYASHPSFARRRRLSHPWRTALSQMCLVAGLTGAVAALAIAHLGSVARPAFVAGALLIAAFYFRRSPWQYLTASLWFWTISPFARRVIDYYAGFEAGSIVLLTPSVMALFMIPPILGSRELLARRESATGAMLLGPVLYGLCLSFFLGNIIPGMVATTEWLMPLLYYFYILHLTPRIGEAEAHIRPFVVLNLVVVATYGTIQCFYPLDWDTQWVADVGMFSMHGSGLFTLKPFSTLNSPGTCAAWVSALILLSLYFRNWISLFALPVGLFFLALTQVRSNLGGVAVGMAAALLSGHRRMAGSVLHLLAVLAVVVGSLAAFDPQVANALAHRFGTVGNLGDDESAQARTELYREFPDMLAKYPPGVGIGGVGRGAVAASGGDHEVDLANIDAGPVAVYVALGWVAGSIYFAGLLAIVVQALLAARRSRAPAALACAIAALGVAATFGFNNLVGLQGLIVWLCAGLASAFAAGATENRRSPACVPQLPAIPALAIASAGPDPRSRRSLFSDPPARKDSITI